MLELLGVKRMSSNGFSLLIRFLYLAIMASGWGMYAFTNFAVSGDTDPFVWVVAVSLVVGVPAFIVSARIEQYWLYAVWGLGVGRAVEYFLYRNPSLIPLWHLTVSGPINAGDRTAPVVKALSEEQHGEDEPPKSD
jgi:hypothetical protein